MQIKAETPEQYINQLPGNRKQVFEKLRNTILENLPEGYTETMNYGMIGYVIPHSVYPKGYHTDPKQPLPLINIASQKNYIALYHFGIYAVPTLAEWFIKEYTRHCKTKLDMGKSCIRFKKTDDIPYQLIAELAGKLSTGDWIKIYETNLNQ